MIYIQTFVIYFLLCSIVYGTVYLLWNKFTITKKSGMLERFSDLEVRDMLVKNLMKEYSHQEIVSFLDIAKIKRYPDKVVVTYSNNKEDIFYANCSIELLHSSELKEK